jgi:hypothetical protein
MSTVAAVPQSTMTGLSHEAGRGGGGQPVDAHLVGLGDEHLQRQICVHDPSLPQAAMPGGREFGDGCLEPGRDGVMHAGNEHHGGRRRRQIQPVLEIGRAKSVAVEILPLRHCRQPPLPGGIDPVVGHHGQFDPGIAHIRQQDGVAKAARCRGWIRHGESLHDTNDQPQAATDSIA